MNHHLYGWRPLDAGLKTLAAMDVVDLRIVKV